MSDRERRRENRKKFFFCLYFLTTILGPVPGPSPPHNENITPFPNWLICIHVGSLSGKPVDDSIIRNKNKWNGPIPRLIFLLVNTCLLNFYLLLLLIASVSVWGPEEAAGPGHGPDHSSSQQLVSGAIYFCFTVAVTFSVGPRAHTRTQSAPGKRGRDRWRLVGAIARRPSVNASVIGRDASLMRGGGIWNCRRLCFDLIPALRTVIITLSPGIWKEKYQMYKSRAPVGTNHELRAQTLFSFVPRDSSDSSVRPSSVRFTRFIYSRRNTIYLK